VHYQQQQQQLECTFWRIHRKAGDIVVALLATKASVYVGAGGKRMCSESPTGGLWALPMTTRYYGAMNHKRGGGAVCALITVGRV